MSFQSALAMLLVTLGGAGIAVQAPINARLALGVDSPVFAAAISFALGFVLLGAVIAIRGGVPDTSSLSALPWWVWTGGAFGAFYVAASAWSVPQIGVLTLVACLILGQMVAALVLDATGAFGLAVRDISPTRLLAVGFVIAGIVLSRL